ncbi:hypothetical protein NHX12_028702, partial [Muraenolepis orangiensis]
AMQGISDNIHNPLPCLSAKTLEVIWEEALRRKSPPSAEPGSSSLSATMPSEFGAGVLKETKWSLGCNRTGAESSERDVSCWKTCPLDQNGPSVVRTARVGPKARAGVDCVSGGRVQPNGDDLIRSSRVPLIQSDGKVIRSNPPLVQSGGLLALGSAGLQVRVAMIKRTRLEPLPSDGPRAAPMFCSQVDPREQEGVSSQGENPQSHPRQRRPSLARAVARSVPGRLGVTREPPVHEKRGPGVIPPCVPESERVESKAEPTPKKTRRKIRLSGVRGRGQLQLSVTPEGNGLDIHIHQARGLLGRNCGSCDTYVKLSLIPDVDHSTRRKTPTVVNSKNPEYNQHFALTVDAENLMKRLQVTVWRRRLTPSRRSEFLGCMSFGIRSLMRSSKSIIGWYYLLGPELGRTKHLKVAPQETRAITPAKPAKGGGGASPGVRGEGLEGQNCLSISLSDVHFDDLIHRFPWEPHCA